jgi:filamentous hemagglutinin family protein
MQEQRQQVRRCDRTANVIAIGVSAGVLAVGLQPPLAMAQIVPDRTLGQEGAVLVPTQALRGAPGLLIRGGARRGGNLFQSFSEFNVGNGQRVYFANPAGVESIFSRVTGRNPSQILGTLGVDGAANLFLINPRGILFGANARLDIAGSFQATTADRLVFENGQSFSASQPEAVPLLNVSVNPGLQLGTDYRGPVVNQGMLAVGSGQTLALAGTQVTSQGSLVAPGGMVQLLGQRIDLLDGARVDVSGDRAHPNGGRVLIGGSLQGKGPLPNATHTTVAPTVAIAADALANSTANGGTAIVWSDQSTRFSGSITARAGNQGGDGGFVEVSGKQGLVFEGRVDASSPFGRPGTFLLDPTNIEVVASGGSGSLANVSDQNQPNLDGDRTRINVDVINNSGTNVILQASDTITFNAPVNITALGIGLTAEAGNAITVNRNIFTHGGAVNLRTATGDIRLNNAEINTNPDFAAGVANRLAGSVELRAGGNVEIDRGTIDARSNSGGSDFTTVQISGQSVRMNQTYITVTNTGTGFAGDIAISAADTVEIIDSNGGIEFGSQREVLPQPPGIFAQGHEGRIYLGVSPYFNFSPNRVRLSNAQLSTNNQASGRSGDADAGLIRVRAIESIDVGNESFIISSTNRQGDAGIVVLQTDGDLRVANSTIRTDAFRASSGSAGGVGLFADSIAIVNQSVISTSTFTPNGAVASTNSDSGAGAVILRARKDIRLDNSIVFNNLENGAVGDGGAILVSGRSLSLQNGAQLQTIVRGNESGFAPARGDGGLIQIEVLRKVEVVGTNPEGLSSGIFTSVGQGVQGNGGGILIGARSVHIRDRGVIRADNLGSGEAGTIAIAAKAVWLDNNALLSALSFSGQGGNILLQLPGALILGRNSNIFTSAESVSPGVDRAGNIAIGSGLLQRSSGGGFQFQDFTLLVAGKTFRGNDILSRGFSIQGGDIRINAFRLQDIERREDIDPTRNNISTKSFNFAVDGTTVVNTLNIFPSFRADPLPDRAEVPRIADGCDPRGQQETSRFTVSGRGGLPSDPGAVLNPEGLANAGATPPAANQPSTPTVAATEIRPAQGWYRDAQGTIHLVAASASKARAIQPAWPIPASCPPTLPIP